MKRLALALAAISALVLASGIGVVLCTYQDQEHVGYTAVAWSDSQWTQTTQADFQAGQATLADLAGSPGNAALTFDEVSGYNNGSLCSQVFDTGLTDANNHMLFWDSTLPALTDITMYARASNSLFDKNESAPEWVNLGTSSPGSSLPAGRYVQWLALLNTTDYMVTPVLGEVRLYYR